MNTFERESPKDGTPNLSEDTVQKLLENIATGIEEPVWIFEVKTNKPRQLLFRNHAAQVLINEEADKIYFYDLFPKEENFSAIDLQLSMNSSDVKLTDRNGQVRNGRMYSLRNFCMLLGADLHYQRLKQIWQARFALIEYGQEYKLPGFLQKMLDEAEKLADSNIGFFHFVEQDQKSIALQAWSTNTRNTMCQMVPEERHYPIEKAGIWVDALRLRKPIVHNDYLSNPRRTGLPEGHTPVARELVVPVFRDNAIVALIGVGNKATNYTREDVDTISQFADLAFDITARKLAQARQVESERKYQLLFEQSGSVMLILDPETGAVLDANEKALQFYGYTKEELKGLYVYDINRTNPAFVKEAMRKVMNNEQSRFEFRHYTKSGEARDVEIYSGTIQVDDKDHIYSIVHDITETKRLRKKLKEGMENYKLLVENQTDLLVKVDSEGRFLYVSDTYCDLFGKKRTDIIGKQFYPFVHEEDIEKTKKAMEDLYKPPYRCYLEQRAYTRQGWRWLAWADKAVLNEAGEVEAIVGVGRDVTERQKLIEDLKIAKERAEESDRLKTAFLQNISHEIRTPMNGIMGFAQLLKNKDLESDSREKFIDIIEQSGKRMLNIINDLVDISKIETGQIELNMSSFSLRELAEELVLFFSQQPGNAHLHFQIDVPKEATIFSDKTKVSQIFSNLLKNAAKYTPQGTIALQIVKEDDKFVCSVEDTGIGIAPKDHTKIFHRFTRVDLTLDSAYEGAGIGLPIARGFVEALGGNMWLQSKEHDGTKFFFTLPFKPLKHSANETVPDRFFTGRQMQSDKIGRKVHILIAEDDEISFEYLKTLLEDFPAEIFHAQTGVEAIAIFEEHPVDLVFMDLKMPEMDGYQALRVIKAKSPELPVVAQTAYAMESDRKEVLQAGFDDYISKPIMQEFLLDVIRKYLEKN